MRGKKLRLKLLQEFFPLLFDSFLLDRIFPHDLGGYLRYRNDWYNGCRNTIPGVACGTGVEVGGIVEPTVGTRQAVPCGLPRNSSFAPHSVSQIIANIAAD